MSAVAFAPPAAAPERADGQPRLFAVPGGSVAADPAPAPAAAARTADTLADLVAGRWTAVCAGRAADCLVCGGRMEPSWSGGHGIVGGRCRDCGTSLD